MKKHEFDLKKLLRHFYTIRKEAGRPILLTKKLENEFTPIKKGEKELSKRHLELLRQDTRFSTWWKMPEFINIDLSIFKGRFADLKPQNKEVIEDLFDVIKNIEIVSCILRFIDPSSYAILSPPVESLLNIRGKNPVEKYLYYLKDLTELKNVYGFKQIADVDIALWVLTNIINYEKLRKNPKYNSIYEVYSKSTNPVKKIMTRNSLLKIKDETPLYKADLILESDPRLAGILACVEMEKIINDLCQKNDIELFVWEYYGKDWLSMSKKLERLENKNELNEKEKEDVLDWWDIRCKLVHGKESKNEINEVPSMIKGIIMFESEHK